MDRVYFKFIINIRAINEQYICPRIEFRGHVGGIFAYIFFLIILHNKIII